MDIEKTLKALPIVKSGAHWSNTATISLDEVVTKIKKIQAASNFEPDIKTVKSNRGAYEYLHLGVKKVSIENEWTGGWTESRKPVTIQRVGEREFKLDDASTYY